MRKDYAALFSTHYPNERAMASIYNLLSINDTSSRQMRWLSRKETDDSFTIGVDGSSYGPAYLGVMMTVLIAQGVRFRNCIFTTHGNEGVIWFGNDAITREVWYNQFYAGGYHRLFPFPDTKLYFAGCNVAAGPDGWKFLESAARSLLRSAGGVAMGWTSLGFCSYFFQEVRPCAPPVK